jgi:hypothetical protein
MTASGTKYSTVAKDMLKSKENKVIAVPLEYTRRQGKEFGLGESLAKTRCLLPPSDSSLN